jgi:hypothetical protein
MRRPPTNPGRAGTPDVGMTASFGLTPVAASGEHSPDGGSAVVIFALLLLKDIFLPESCLRLT